MCCSFCIGVLCFVFSCFFFKQKTAYEVRISDWSSDVCSSDLGLKGAITRVMGATWQRCRVHFMRNALSYVPKGQNTVVAAALRQVFLQPAQKSATPVWRQDADQLRTRWPNLGACMDEAEADVLTYTGFPTHHRPQLHSTNQTIRPKPAGQHP